MIPRSFLNTAGDEAGQAVEPRLAKLPKEAAVSVRGLSKSFRGARVLEEINFDVAEGEALVLLGASGSGKTTILRILAGLDAPDTGSVILHGREVTNLPAQDRGVGVIFQSYALFPRMTVEENVAYGLRIRRRPRREIVETVDRLLKLVRLEEHRNKYPLQLSGGQQQRVAIARTLAYKPEVLLFDEPFGALDAQTRVRLRREIRGLLREINVPSIFITHDQEEALELGDRIAVLNAGHLEQTGTPQEVYNRPASEYVATFLGTANLLPGVVTDRSVRIGARMIFAPEETARLSEGQPVKLLFRPEHVCLCVPGEPPNSCQNLSDGWVEEVNFVGAYERLTLRLKLSQCHPVGEDSARHDPSRGAAMSDVVTVMRQKSEATGPSFGKGDNVRIGLRSFCVLPDSGQTGAGGGQVVDLKKWGGAEGNRLH
jgi:ABC-type Fe3+/spermidine/putrescine transport system ATPase subunit